MQSNDRKQLQRQHEDYWGKCWAEALAQHLDAQVQSNRPNQDPPDVEFQIRMEDETRSTTWGEVTGVYYDSQEAKWLWGSGSENQQGRGYFEPDAVVGTRAAELVEGKLRKYSGTGEPPRAEGIFWFCSIILVVLHAQHKSRCGNTCSKPAMRNSQVTQSHSKRYGSLAIACRGPRKTKWKIPSMSSKIMIVSTAGLAKCVWARKDLASNATGTQEPGRDDFL